MIYKAGLEFPGNDGNVVAKECRSGTTTIDTNCPKLCSGVICTEYWRNTINMTTNLVPS